LWGLFCKKKKKRKTNKKNPNPKTAYTFDDVKMVPTQEIYSAFWRASVFYISECLISPEVPCPMKI